MWPPQRRRQPFVTRLTEATESHAMLGMLSALTKSEADIAVWWSGKGTLV